MVRLFHQKKNNIEIINFDELNINLNELVTSTIKRPKIQETSTIKLISCISKNLKDEKFCTKDSKKKLYQT